MGNIIRKFRKEDIGGELLPILTTGLYRDVLDTLREYIQNGIDAKAKKIELSIDVDQIAIRDDGTGMDEQVANNAIRLGISDKNPATNVGFRGIGIYSSFNLCENAEIYTKHKGDRNTYHITFDFKKIKHDIEVEQERRKNEENPELFLEKLLNNSVNIAISEEKPIKGHGTLVILSGLNSDMYQRLNDWDIVSSYLESVVPLPFHQGFKYGKEIQAKLESNDHSTISIELQINNRKEKLYKPYTNELFHHGGRYPVEFFDLKTKGYDFGFAWVCINDEAAVLRDKKLRGLLIKKFGFSVNERVFLEGYFSLSTKYRRITGEIVLRNNELIPNAARSDFEHNTTRQAFFEHLPSFISSLTKRIDEKDREIRAAYALSASWDELRSINNSFPSVRRDKEKLLKLNSQLMQIHKKLNTHKTTLKQIAVGDWDKINKFWGACDSFVKEELTKKKKSRKKLEEQIAEVIDRGLQESMVPGDQNIPKSIIQLIEIFGLTESNELLDLIGYVDEFVLQENTSGDDYLEFVLQVYEYLEAKQ